MDMTVKDGGLFKQAIHPDALPVCFVSSVGLWKIVARFPSIPQMSYSAEFEIKEYGELHQSFPDVLVMIALMSGLTHILTFQCCPVLTLN